MAEACCVLGQENVGTEQKLELISQVQAML